MTNGTESFGKTEKQDVSRGFEGMGVRSKKRAN